MTYMQSRWNTQPEPTPDTHNVYWISDDGHGWLAVSLHAYPGAIEYGTGFGYMDNAYIFLEEDLEAVAFLTDHPELAGANKRGELAEKRYDGDAPVRRLGKNLDIMDTEAFYARCSAENTGATV
jgi:hypothetical protein